MTEDGPIWSLNNLTVEDADSETEEYKKYPLIL